MQPFDIGDAHPYGKRTARTLRDQESYVGIDKVIDVSNEAVGSKITVPAARNARVYAPDFSGIAELCYEIRQ